MLSDRSSAQLLQRIGLRELAPMFERGKQVLRVPQESHDGFEKTLRAILERYSKKSTVLYHKNVPILERRADRALLKDIVTSAEAVHTADDIAYTTQEPTHRYLQYRAELQRLQEVTWNARPAKILVTVNQYAGLQQHFFSQYGFEQQKATLPLGFMKTQYIESLLEEHKEELWYGALGDAPDL